jgi:hypothetical protein
LKGYQHEVWNFLYSFESFNINSIPHCQNVDADILANATSRFIPPNDGFSIEIIFRPSILDNVTNWRVFNNDTQIINFLTSFDVFQDSVIDDEAHEQDLQDYRDESSKTKANCIPKNVLSLEKLFDLQTKFRRLMNPKTNNSTMMHFLVNLGTPEQPKYINLGTCCSEEEKHTFMQLFKRYRDVFSWTYEYLKTYDTCIIQHVIPIKEGVKPFQQKLRKIHPTLEPLIQKELKKLLDALDHLQSSSLNLGV